jgi:hypothetical protein
MDKDFDISRLESNLYLDLLAIFEEKTKLETESADPLRSLCIDQTSMQLESLALEWLMGHDSRTIEQLTAHVWPNICEMATSPEPTDEEADSWDIFEALGFTDPDEVEHDTLFVLDGMLYCARALADTDPETMFMSVLSASYYYGVARGCQYQREGIAANSAHSVFSRKGARARHKENHALRADALQYYQTHRHEFNSKDDAALAIAEKVVPVKFRTVRKWLTEPKEKSTAA